MQGNGVINPQEIQRFSLEIPSELRYLIVLDSFLENIFVRGISEDANQQYGASLLLAVHELCTNIITHAYAGENQGQIRFEIRISQHPLIITVETFDCGAPLSDDKITSSQKTAELHVHGYGLFLMKQIMDEVHYERVSNGNRWIMTKEIKEVS